MVVVSALFVMLCLTGFTFSYPQKHYPTENLENEIFLDDCFCSVEESDGEIHLNFSIVSWQLRKEGSFSMKKLRDRPGKDVNDIISTTRYVKRPEGIYLVNTLYTLGENGFEYSHNILVTAYNVSESTIEMIQTKFHSNDTKCDAKEENGKIGFFFSMVDCQNRGGKLILKDFGKDVGKVENEAEYLYADDKLYLVETLKTTGENGFEFELYKNTHNVMIINNV